MKKRINTKKAADIIGVTDNTLAVWRCTKRYPQPPYVKIGSKVYYFEEDCEAFVEAQTVRTEAV